MLTKLEKINVLLNLTKEKYFDNVGLFRWNDLKLFGIEMPIKKIKGYQCTYGYDKNGLGYYFIVVTRNYEGFIWCRSSHKENGAYKTKDTIMATNEFISIKETFKSFELNVLRDLFIQRVRGELTEIQKNYFSLELILANISGVSLTSISKREIRAKTIGMLLILLSTKREKGVFNKKIVVPQNTKYSEFYFNDYLSEIIIKNIEYILKNNIDLTSIEFTIE